MLKKLASLENGIAVAALMLTAFLPILDIVIRKFIPRGIPGAAMFVQHLVLWMAFLGAALGARRGELLSLSTGAFLKGKVKKIAEVFSSGVSVTVCAVLAKGSLDFVLVEYEGGRTLALGIPVWIAEAIMPIGFAVIGLRILKHISTGWKGRLAAALFLLFPIAAGHMFDLRDAGFAMPLVFIIIAAVVFGAPIFIGLGGLAAVLLWNDYQPLSAIPLETYNLSVQAILPTIPLFTLAGYILAEGGTPRKLVELFRSFFGWMPGGVALVAVLVCAFFTSFTGGSGVTILAMGGLLYPMMMQEKYSHRFTTGLLTSAGSLGLMFPPSLAVILYCVVSELDIVRFFVSGFLPTLLLVVLIAGYAFGMSKKAGIKKVPFQWKRALKSVIDAKWEAAIPFIVLGSILGGFATLVQASAITAIYAFCLEFFIRRNLSLRRDLPKVAVSAAALIGGVLLILGMAMGLTNFMVIASIPDIVVDGIQSLVQSKFLFLLLLNLFLLIIGCFMDIYSAITVVVPLIVPLGIAFGINPYHLGVIFLTNLELGYLTPPVGLNLFLASYRFKRPLGEVYRAALPFLALRAVAVVMITYVPYISLMLPNLFLD